MDNLSNIGNLVGVISFGDSGGGTETDDHRNLTHRDANNQHPESAITGLVADLADRPSEKISDEFINAL